MLRYEAGVMKSSFDMSMLIFIAHYGVLRNVWIKKQ
jgi:hypothetical protein